MEERNLLIVVDSIMSLLRESKMSFKGNIKSHFFPGTRIEGMYNYLLPLLRKRLDKIIFHVRTNDARHIKADEMLKE